eukprot:1140783-Pelagomonas_calceolata.AAC.8
MTKAVEAVRQRKQGPLQLQYCLHSAPSGQACRCMMQMVEAGQKWGKKASARRGREPTFMLFGCWHAASRQLLARRQRVAGNNRRVEQDVRR